MSIDQLIEDWESVYRKGQLTLWMLLALRDGEKYMDEIRLFISDITEGQLEFEEQSLYRSLRKFEELEVLSSRLEPTSNGPARKIYSLTEKGKEMLTKFVNRNLSYYYSRDIKYLLFPNRNANEHETVT